MVRTSTWVAAAITVLAVLSAFDADGATTSAPATTRRSTQPSSQPASLPASQPASRPSSMPVAAPPHASETVNALIDNMLATGMRLLELPLLLVLGGIGLIGVVLAAILRRICGKNRAWLGRILSVMVTVLVALAVLWVIDRKVASLQGEVYALRDQIKRETAAIMEVASKREAKRTSYLFDVAAAEQALKKPFGAVRLRPLIYDEATDIVEIRRMDPIAQAWLVVVDLRNPAVELRVGTTIQHKRLTSEFARENDCAVAINGEAGVSPQADSGLGDWIGNLIDRGNVVLMEDTAKHPFLSFDRTNRPTYSPAAVVDKTVTPEKYNVIWGRSDVIVNGVPSGDQADRQPRTAMAVNADGTRLYLLVVDGRQPTYSLGLSRQDVGRLLQAFGAHDGMLCDEGGSSCLYLKRFGGIRNIPSDQRGQERPTYTHFGVIVHEPK